MKPTRSTNFSNLFLEWNFTCFGQFLCPSAGGFHCPHTNGICRKCLLKASCQQTCMTYTIAVCTVKTPDDGQRNCPKHVKFYFKKWEISGSSWFYYKNLSRCTVTPKHVKFCSKNKFEKLVDLVGFITRIYHEARSPRNMWTFILKINLRN